MRTHLREMTPADVPAVLELAREQNERDGTSYAVPQVFDAGGNKRSNVALALVAVDDEGTVRQSHIYEITLEQMSFGVDARATVCSMHEQDAVFYLLRKKGFTEFHLLVPEQRAAAMESGLESILKMSATGLRHYLRLLDRDDNDRVRRWYKNNRVRE